MCSMIYKEICESYANYKLKCIYDARICCMSESIQNNTFQAIVITDGTRSYSVFTYKCGELQWSYNGPTIGYNAGGAYFKNHPNTGSFAAHEIACLNSPQSDWYNVVYNLSVSLSAGTLAPPPTVEPRKCQT